MTLLDKLRDIRSQPADMDLLEYFGLKPGDRFSISEAGVTVGTETLSIADARLAMNGGPVFQPPGPRRSVFIGDL